MTVCDVCSQSLNFSDGYALTTQQVTTDEAYWTYMLEHNRFDDELLAMYVQQQAMQTTGWLICETCSRLFTFNRSTAKDYARRQANPPGSGPVNPQQAASAAARAWKQKHGSFPSWVR